MAFDSDKFGRSTAAPGLPLFGEGYRAVSYIIQDSVESEGGFPLFGVAGSDGLAWGSLTAATEAAGDDGSVYFAGVAVREAIRDEFEAGEPVAACREGSIWVKVAEDVQSGAKAYYTADGGFGAAGTEIEGATYQTTALADGLALVELK